MFKKSMKWVLLAFFSFFLVCAAGQEIVARQEIVPNDWNGEAEKLPEASLEEKEALEESSAPEESVLYRKIVQTFRLQQENEVRASSKEFLDRYPDSEWRHSVLAILRKTCGKNLQLYALGSVSLWPGNDLYVMLSGIRTTDVKMSIWKVDLLHMIQNKWDLRAPRRASRVSKVSEWTEKIDPQVPIFCKRIPLPTLPPGCYSIDAEESDVRATLTLLVSAVGMAVKQDGKIALVWVGRKDGKPLGSPASLYFLHNQQLTLETKTNPSGVWAARLEKRLPSMTVLALHEGHAAIVENDWSIHRPLSQKCFMEMDRPFYRPGETLNARVVLRTMDPISHQYGFQNRPIWLTIQDERFRALFQRELSPDSFGTVPFSYPFSEKATAGRYCLRMHGGYIGESYFQVLSQEPACRTWEKGKSGDESVGRHAGEVSGEFDLHMPKMRYSQGEDISLEIKCPPNGPVMITHEAGRILSYRLLTPGYPFSDTRRVTDRFSPIVKISAMQVGAEKLLSVSREIEVPSSKETIEISAKSDKTEYQPGENVKIGIEVADFEGNLASASLAVSVVPHYEWKDRVSIHDFYNRKRHSPIPPSSSFQFEFLSDQDTSTLHPEIPTSPLFSKNEVHPEKSSPHFYWNPFLVSDERGKAEVEFPMPGGAKKWSVRISGIDRESRVGEAFFSIESGIVGK